MSILRVVESWYASDLGRQRQGNEDNLFARAPLFVVADGMGGAQAGEVASEIAVQEFEEGLPVGLSVRDGLVERIGHANHRIFELSQTDSGRAGMGTTITAAFVDEQSVVIAHVGDSRAYRLRAEELRRITTDHSLVGELMAQGKLTKRQAAVHPQRSVITRALGPEPEVEVDLIDLEAAPGDVFMLCSDGLTSMVKESVIRKIMLRARSLAQAGQELIKAANAAGGRDNITVVLFRVGDVEADGLEGDISQARSAEAGLLDGREGTVHGSPEGGSPQARGGEVALLDGREGTVPDFRLDGRRARRGRRLLVGSIATAVILSALVMGGWFATKAVYFVGVDSSDQRTITVFRGLPYELPGGVKLYERFEPSGVTLEQVPEGRRETFTNHKLRSQADAESLIAALERGELE